MGFLDFRFLDFLDILIFSLVLYQVYMLIRGTVAMKIFAGIFALYLLWIIVKALDMKLLSSILGQVMGVGVVALLIVFQQEIRRFFLYIGDNYLNTKTLSLEYLFRNIIKPEPQVQIYPIINACLQMAKSKTGALIIIEQESDLSNFALTGVAINADTNKQLLLTLFFKNTPLHDGAIIIRKDRILAASCVLPVSESEALPEEFGLRHRSAFGLAEQTDAIILVVSEERGVITIFNSENIIHDVKPMEMRRILKKMIDYHSKNINLHDFLERYKDKILQKIKDFKEDTKPI